jgi:glycosyltransferase involved in cell wall biosynthesis
MKLLFCIKSMNNPGGGAERVLADITNGLSEQGHSVSLLTFDKEGGESFYSLNQKIERICLGIGATNTAASTVSTLRRIRALRRCTLKIAPDVAIGFMHSMFIPLSYALIGTGIPVIASEHIVPKHYKTRPLQALLLSVTPLFVRKITCVSNQVLQSYPSFLRKKMVSISNPISVFSEQKACVLGGSSDKKTLLTVGRLEAQKNHKVLIDAFAQISSKVPDWELRIVGEGSKHISLLRQVKKYGLCDRIIFTGSIKNISKEYIASQLFVLPSDYESFGLTILEANAHGLPVVGFDDCQGVNELIQHNISGVLVHGGSNRSGSLASSLLKLMQNDQMRLQLSNNVDGALAEFRIEHVLHKWNNVISDVIAEKECI